MELDEMSSGSESLTAKIRLTRRAIEAAVADHRAGARTRHWFADIPGMYLQITPKGCASYCLRFEKLGGGKGDYTIGRISRITPEMAKEAAQARFAALTLNHVDPVDARREVREEARAKKLRTFASLAEAFMSAPENRKLAKGTKQLRQWLLDKHIIPRIGATPFEGLRRADVKECVRAIQANAGTPKAGAGDEDRTGNRTANLCHGVIRRIFNWAIGEDRCETNPAVFTKLFDDTPVRRVGALNDDRMRTIWLALDHEAANGWGTATVLAMQLVILTLQRPNEVTQAHKDDIDWKERMWRIPESRTKTNTLYEIPLTDDAVCLFQRAFKLSKSAWAFLGEDGKTPLRANVLSHRFEKTRRRLVKAGRLPSADVQLYDTRRFGRTRLVQGLGFPEHIAERVINHAPDRSMARRYDVGDYSSDIRRAQEAWAAELRRIVSGNPTPFNVVSVSFGEAAE